MKPVSVIFLIVSGILIIVGLLVCSVAMVKANNEDIDLYDMKIEDGQSKAEYDFSEDVFNRIQISVGKCDVNVVFGADENKVVIHNFSSAGYICKVENRSLVVEDSVNLLDFTALAQGEFGFKGFRYYLRDRKITSPDKSVTVYMTDKFDLKALDVTVEKGVVSLTGYKNGTDYNISITEGELNAGKIDTDSTVNVKIGKGGVKMKEVAARVISIETGDGNIEAVLSGHEITLLAKKGNVLLESMDDLNDFNFSLKAPNSTVSLNDLTKNVTYIANDALLSKFIHATSETGFVKISVYSPSDEIGDIETDEAETERPSEDSETAGLE